MPSWAQQTQSSDRGWGGEGGAVVEATVWLCTPYSPGNPTLILPAPQNVALSPPPPSSLGQHSVGVT